VVAIDLVEDYEAELKNNDGWAVWKFDGPVKAGCEKHPVNSNTYDRHGRMIRGNFSDDLAVSKHLA
jgi:hypothetical protein